MVPLYLLNLSCYSRENLQIIKYFVEIFSKNLINCNEIMMIKKFSLSEKFFAHEINENSSVLCSRNKPKTIME